MSHSKFYSSIVLLIILNAVIKPLWIFGIDRQVQNIAGVAEYGTYFSLYNLSVVFGFLLDWGLTNFVNRELASKRIELQQQLGSLLGLKFLFFILYSLVVIVVAAVAGVHQWNILLSVILVQFLTYLFLFLRSVVTANQWFQTDAWLSVLDKALMILICGTLIFLPVLFGPIDIQRFLSAQVISTTIAIITVLFILLSRRVSFRRPSIKSFHTITLLSALPFALTVFLMSIHVRLDGFLLERMYTNGPHEAGIYAAAYRLLDASNMVGYLIASFLMPFAARLWSEGKPLQETILRTRHLQIMFAITIAAITIMLGPWLQKILYHRDDVHGAQILQWCIPALLGYALVQVYGTIMTATGSIVSFCYLNLGAVVINIVLNVILIPRYGAMACCISALVSQVLLGISSMVAVHRKLRTPVGASSILVYLLNGFLICAVFYLLLRTSIHTILLLPIALIITALTMLFARMISLNNWLSFLKKQ